jgi:5-formyltetrahydrofolate cyclo-ligase
VSDPHSEKSAMRARLRANRATLPDADRARETAASVLALRTWLDERQPPALAAYLAVRSELDLADLIHGEWAASKTVWLPRIVDEELVWHPISDRSELHPGSYHIPEPDPERSRAAKPPAGTVVLIPGIGFGSDGRRLGQGGGYFDRWLARVSGVIAIGIGFSCQRCDDLPLEAHDQHCHGVLLGGTWLVKP